jgi:MoCo/4Fe-4S cofactor protein with predicted Tat translocation signal
MKSPPSPSPRHPTGPQYWRSLDELERTPAFREWLEREFPEGATEWRDPVSRRHFMKIMSASFLLAGFGLTGCRRPEEIIHPFSRLPENYTHGVPKFYATAIPVRGSAQSLLVKSHDGRPLKIEGNPHHPLGQSGTDRFAQASILNLYDPDRATSFRRKESAVTRDMAFDFLSATAKELAASSGEGVCFLLEQSSSPSRRRLQGLISERYPKTRWFVYEPVDFSVARQAASDTHSPGAVPGPAELSADYHLDQAKVVVSLDCDFLGGEEEAARWIRDFARSRKIEQPSDPLSRLYTVETLLTLTGANADHRLRLASSQVLAVAAKLAAEVLGPAGIAEAASLVTALSSVSLPAETEQWIKTCAQDLLAQRGTSVVLAGQRQPLVVHYLALAVNRALGNEGKTVRLAPRPEAKGGTIEELAQALNAGQVKTLLILGGNPVYNAPADLDWAAAQRKAGTVVRLGYYEDETAAACDWQIPAAHYLESWGDARTSDGTLVSIQPLIAPLFDGLTELELLARVAGLQPVSPYEIVRETLRQRAAGGDFEAVWKRFVHDGFLADSAARPVGSVFNWSRVTELVRASAEAIKNSAETKASKDQLEVVFHRDYSVDDGRYANNGWLQEFPDPITKLTWENVITLSPKTAKELGVYFENPERGKLLAPRAKVELDGRTVEGPV